VRVNGVRVKMCTAVLLAGASCLLAASAFAQEEAGFTSDQFEVQVLEYTPVQREGVSDASFAQGLFYLEQTKAAVGHNPDNFNVAHYWNVAVAFLTLGEPAAHIALAFQAAIEDSEESVCVYLDHMGRGSRFEAEIPEVIDPLLMSCDARATIEEEAFDVERYAAEHDLSEDLVREIVEILEDDQRHRRPLLEEQAALDAANQARIDALFEHYGAYIGRSLVGEELDYVMFLVIQHSHLEYMERYLPYVQQAVATGELGDVTPLKMLLDRIYYAREGYQIFGSQGPVPIADEETRRLIMETYAIPQNG
jgi:hypothetical protein